MAQIPRQGGGGGGKIGGGGGSGSPFGNANAVSSPEKVAAPPNQTEFSETVTHTPKKEKKKMMMTSRAIPDFLFLQLHTRLIHNAAKERV